MAPKNALETIGKADCVVIITDHTGFDYQGLLESSKLIVDTRNALRGIDPIPSAVIEHNADLPPSRHQPRQQSSLFVPFSSNLNLE